MVVEGGESIASVARQLSLNEGTLGNWVGAYRRANPQPVQPCGVPRQPEGGHWFANRHATLSARRWARDRESPGVLNGRV